MTQEIAEAVYILQQCYLRVSQETGLRVYDRWWLKRCLGHAIRHIAYPDRDTYPKVRGRRKTSRRRKTNDTLAS